MATLRQIRRNKLKFNQGNNKIRKAWRSEQIDNYSIQGYCDMYNRNNPRKNTKLTPKTAYMV